jgi:hypothetical protein
MRSGEVNRNKVRQVASARIAWSEKGIAHVIKDLSNPLGLTLNQRVVGSPPTRPTKIKKLDTLPRHPSLRTALNGTLQSVVFGIQLRLHPKLSGP